jgi:glucosamine--fructose-6-phosphate aminotransferase (isomerizing)
MSGTLFEQEIREQPDVLERVLHGEREAAEALAAAARARRPPLIAIAARGSSDNAARYAKYLFGLHHRLVVALAAPALHTVYRRPPELGSALVIGISQSGASPDVVSVVADAASQGALSCAVTNDPGSPLAAAAAHVLALRAGDERAVAASKTYTAELAVLAMISAALSEGDEATERVAALAALPAAVAGVLDRAEAIAELAAPLETATRIVVLGRGLHMSTAFETALKLKETSYVSADAYSSADFLHGPIAMLDASTPVLWFRSAADADEAAEDLRRRVEAAGAPLIVIGEGEDDGDDLALGGELPHWLAPIQAAVAGQLLALSLARQKGHDPDRPRGLAKITRTR